MVCSTFSRSGWSVVRSALLASKKRLSLHLHKILTWSNKVSPRTFQTALVEQIFAFDEIEGSVLALQDRDINTKNYKMYILEGMPLIIDDHAKQQLKP
jgi:hypothetical protein